MTATISAMTIVGTLTLYAQTPQTPNPQTSRPQTTTPQTTTPQTTDPQAPQTSANPSERMLTLTGCLQAEKDVPGRKESMTERAGMGEDYVLTNVKMAQGASTSGMGLGSMYQIKGGAVKDSDLKSHLGHQVEVMGSIEAYSDIRGGTSGRDSDSPAGTPRATTAKGNSNLANFTATSIKMISATCAAQ